MDRIEATGLKELLGDLRAVDRRLTKTFQVENKLVAEEVATKVRAAYSSAHPPQSGRGAASIRGTASQTRATVAMGTARAPYTVGQDFGSARTRPHTRQFPIAVKGGRFLYPVIERTLPGLVARYARALEEALMGLES